MPITTYSGPSTARVVAFAGQTAALLLLPANADRKGAIISNPSTSILYIKYGMRDGILVSATNHTAQIATLLSHVVPLGYTGEIWVLQSASNGNILATELF